MVMIIYFKCVSLLQILACIVFILLELAICAIHLNYRKPCVEENEHPDRIRLECQSSSNDIASAHSLNVVLLAFCTLYAFKTRNLPDNFNEAKFIAFSCYATAITWSAFLLIYFGSSLRVRRLESFEKNYFLYVPSYINY